MAISYPEILVGTSRLRYFTNLTSSNYSNSNYNLALFIFAKIQVRYPDFILVDLPNLHSFSVCYCFWVCLSQVSFRGGQMLFKKPVFKWTELAIMEPKEINEPIKITVVRKSTTSLLKISNQHRLCFLKF